MAQSAKYIMVINKIKEWIEAGKVKPGDKIYSENELSKMFQVSRHTIRQAIGELVHEGLLYREQGAGTFCAEQPEILSPSLSKPITSGKNIGIITTYISDYIFPTIIRGMESYLTSKGYSLFISSTNNEVEKEKQCLEAMLERNVDGLIIEPTKSSGYNPNIPYYLELEQKKIPYLMINQYYSQLNPPYILMDDEKGGLMATEHLIELGHNKIIGIFKTDDLQGIYRMKGFINAFRNHQIPFQNDTVISYTTEDLPNVFQEKIENLLADPEQTPTGIVCYNDEIALKIIHILKGKGYRIPDDISIIGYDNSALVEASEVKITSINHPKAQLGIDAAKWIVEAIEHPDTFEKQNVTYEPELIIRESTKAI